MKKAVINFIRFSYDTINYNLPQPAPSPPTTETGSAQMIKGVMLWHALYTAFVSRSCSIDPDRCQFHHRDHSRRVSGILQRLAGPDPATDRRNLDQHAQPVHSDYLFIHVRAWILDVTAYFLFMGAVG